MYHFFAKEQSAAEGVIVLTGQDAWHIGHVLRLRPGDRIRVSDKDDRDAVCEITRIQSDAVETRVLPEAVEDTELPVRIVLFQGLPKADKMEWILQKCVELGAAAFVPVEMKRCVMKLDAGKKEARRERWQKLAESAAKQSGRRILPEVLPVMSFEDALRAARETDAIVVPYEASEGMARSREVFSALPRGGTAALFIGPEGGFDPSEIEALESAGGVCVSLGHRILRTETAGMAALAMCAILLED